jgi:TrpR family trp operon transcriptional repressor
MSKNNRLTTENITDLGELAENLFNLKDSVQVLNLLRELHTEAELHNLSLRWRLLKMLHQGTPQRSIAENLGISLCKITRGSKLLKEPESVCSQIIPRVVAQSTK